MIFALNYNIKILLDFYLEGPGNDYILINLFSDILLNKYLVLLMFNYPNFCPRIIIYAITKQIKYLNIFKKYFVIENTFE